MQNVKKRSISKEFEKGQTNMIENDKSKVKLKKEVSFT